MKTVALFSVFIGGFLAMYGAGKLWVFCSESINDMVLNFCVCMMLGFAFVAFLFITIGGFVGAVVTLFQS